jgi:hypothetical protein
VHGRIDAPDPKELSRHAICARTTVAAMSRAPSTRQRTAQPATATRHGTMMRLLALA